MASSLSRMLEPGEQRGDGTAREQLKRAAGRGVREAMKGVVKEAIEETDAESRRSGGSRGMVALGLGAIAGYLVRDWQLRPETYESIEAELGEEVSEMSEEVSEAREEYTEDGSRSRTSRLGRLAGVALLVGVGYAMLRQRRRARRTEQWTEERGQEQGGVGGDAGRMGEPGGTSESGEQGGESGGMDESSAMGGESEEQETTAGGGTSSESTAEGSSESSSADESSE